MATTLLLVTPVRRDTTLGMLVHFMRSDLDLQRLAVITDDHSVNRLVEVGLGCCDIVVELLWQVVPEAVDNAERRITVGNRIDEDTQGTHIEDMREVLVLALHLLPDAEDMLRATADVCPDASPAELLLQGPDGFPDERETLLTALLELAGDVTIGLGLEKTQGEILEFPLDLPDTEAVRDRREDIPCIAAELLLYLRWQIAEAAHEVHALCKNDEQHLDIVGYRQQHSPEIFRMLLTLLLARCEYARGEPLDAGQVTDPLYDDRTVSFLQFLLAEMTGAESAIENRCCQGFIVELEMNQQVRDMQDVENELLPGSLNLVAECIEDRMHGADKLFTLVSPLGGRQGIEPLLDLGFCETVVRQSLGDGNHSRSSPERLSPARD